MLSADSNVVLRLILRDDEDQYRAARGLLRTSAGCFVSHVVLAEVTWTLVAAYGFPRRRIGAAVERLLETDGVIVQDPETVKGALADHEASKADFGDCLILAIARKHGALPLATFDAALAKVDGTRKLGGRAR